MSVRARHEPASVQHEDAEGIYLTPQQVAEARAILREIRELPEGGPEGLPGGGGFKSCQNPF